MRLGVLADIHGNVLALEAVLADLKKRNVDTVVNLGDHVFGMLWPRETIEILMRQPWIHISGNCDHKPQRELGPTESFVYSRLSTEQEKWLEALPATARLEPGILACHGTPESDIEPLVETVVGSYTRLAEPEEIQQRLTAKALEAEVFLCGHTHLQRTVRVGKTLVVNPGSIGLPAYDHDYPAFHLIQAGTPHARYAVLEKTTAGWNVEMISVSYDHMTAARQARANGREDWATALETGYALKPQKL